MSEQFLYFLQQMFNGVTLGSTYALIAIGYTMVYGIIGMINFAHGEVYMIGSYVSFMIIAALMMMGIDTSWLLVAAGFIGAIIIASAYGWSIERVAYRPVRNSKRLIALISAIGMSIFLQNYVSLTEGSRDVALPSLFNGQWIVGSSEKLLWFGFLDLPAAGGTGLRRCWFPARLPGTASARRLSGDCDARLRRNRPYPAAQQH